MRILCVCNRGVGHFTPLVPFIDAWRRDHHEVLVLAPPPLAPLLSRAGYPFRLGAEPRDEELQRLWQRIALLPRDEADRLRIAEGFAHLNVRARLPATRSAVREWRPDVIVADHLEFASAVVARETGVPRVQVTGELITSFATMLSGAESSLEAWATGLTQQIHSDPYLTLWPASVDDLQAQSPPQIHRFRHPATQRTPALLPDWWPGDPRPLVYVSFGTVAPRMPKVRPVYDAALTAVRDLPARVLLSMGTSKAREGGAMVSSAPHIHIASWVPEIDVLGHARVVVCHGGTGTTLGAVAAGVPLVVTPLFGISQLHVARRIAAVGAGVMVSPRGAHPLPTDVDPVALREAVDTVMTDRAFAHAAGRIADEITQLPDPGASLPLLLNLT